MSDVYYSRSQALIARHANHYWLRYPFFRILPTRKHNLIYKNKQKIQQEKKTKYKKGKKIQQKDYNSGVGTQRGGKLVPTAIG